jgi:hypothetical protein
MYFLFRDKGESACLLPEILSLLEDCICQETEGLARMGLGAFANLVNTATSSDPTDATLDLLCSRVTMCLAANCCLDFGSAGSLRLSRDTPPEVSDAMKECPLALRRSALHSNSLSPREEHLDAMVKTPYGQGIIIEVCLILD